MTQTLIESAYLEAWNATRDAREQQRRDPYGYLAYAGFHQLGTTPESFDAIPGRWSTGPDGPLVELADGLVVDGLVIAGTHQFPPLAERERLRSARAGDVVLELSKRGGQDLLRPIDPAFRRRFAYDHTPAWEPDPRWVLEGQFVPFPSLRPAQLDATIGGLVHTHSTLGEIVLTLDGVEQRLLVIASDGHAAGVAGTGLVLFTDATSGSTTDRQGRSLQVEVPAGVGPVTLDFNLAGNLQRPYTAFAPCPLPPAQNRLSVAVEAGEQLPVFR